VPKLETVQWMGQGPELHCRVSELPPQLLPPLAAARVVVRERDLDPVPQVLEHAVHVDQAPWEQSTGQEAVLQD
jgi:hypothetical protein